MENIKSRNIYLKLVDWEEEEEEEEDSPTEDADSALTRGKNKNYHLGKDWTVLRTPNTLIGRLTFAYLIILTVMKPAMLSRIRFTDIN